MKKQRKYGKSNWVEILVSSITILIAVGFEVYSYFFQPLSIFENMILTLLIFIATSFMVTQLTSFSRLNSFINQYEKDKNEVRDKGIVRSFDSAADAMSALQIYLMTGTHTFDTVSLDQRVRTRTTSVGKHPTVQLINDVVKNKDILTRYLFIPRSDNIGRVINRIATSNHGENSFYAYIKTNNMPPFASFQIVDKRILLIRSPFSEGETAEYILVEDSEIVNIFNSWFASLWKSAIKIDSRRDLEDLFSEISSELSDQKKSELLEAMSNVQFIDE